MARGHLRCLGNSLRLKSRFGSGYRVSVRVLGSGSGAAGAGMPGPSALGSSPSSSYSNPLCEIQAEPVAAAAVAGSGVGGGHQEQPGGQCHQRDPVAARHAAAVKALFLQQLAIKPCELQTWMMPCHGHVSFLLFMVGCSWGKQGSLCQHGSAGPQLCACSSFLVFETCMSSSLPCGTPQATSPWTMFTSWCLTSTRSACPPSLPTSRRARLRVCLRCWCATVGRQAGRRCHSRTPGSGLQLPSCTLYALQRLRPRAGPAHGVAWRLLRALLGGRLPHTCAAAARRPRRPALRWVWRMCSCA